MAKSLFEKLGGKFEKQGDYLLPCLTVPTEEEQPIVAVVVQMEAGELGTVAKGEGHLWEEPILLGLDDELQVGILGIEGDVVLAHPRRAVERICLQICIFLRREVRAVLVGHLHGDIKVTFVGEADTPLLGVVRKAIGPLPSTYSSAIW